jgi:hypothetical protein
MVRVANTNCLRCKAPLRPHARFCRRCGLLIASASSNNTIAGNPSPPYQPAFRGVAPTVPPQSSLDSQFQSQPLSALKNPILSQRSLAMNANDAKIVSVYTRVGNGNIPSVCLRVSVPIDEENPAFEVVVEARAGWVLSNSSAPYLLSLVAFDITSGQNANPCTAFVKTVTEHFNSTTGTSSQWPEYKSVFPVMLTQAQADALVGHVLQYTVTFISPPPGSGSPANVVSFLRGEPFILV